MNNDLISRKWLTDAIRNRRTYLSYEDAKDVIDLINNAPTVKAFTEEDMAGAYNEGYMCGSKEAEKAKEGELVKAYTKGFDNGVEIARTERTERTQGKWLDIYESHIAYECSNCHRQMPVVEFNFCPNCGADMRKGGAE